MSDKTKLHRNFWKGEGPSLILIPPFNEELYDLNDYPARFFDPGLMWESEMRRARAVVDWPTDGIPTIRPNLGVIAVPAMAGKSYILNEGSMPWPGQPLTREEIRDIPMKDITDTEIFRLVKDFYQIHRESGNDDVYLYLPDTEGVFDIAHILYGDQLFYDVLDNDPDGWFMELMEISMNLYINATKSFKSLINEKSNYMVHGHGTEQGFMFPATGVRVSEDTVLLLSPDIIEESIIPFIRRSVEPFGGGFLHFCGYHPTIFSQFSALSCIKAIDLGNPEKFEIKSILERCAETDTVLYSRVAEEPGESWREYIQRIGSLVASTGARVILRPKVFPETSEECNEMLEIWHNLTSV